MNRGWRNADLWFPLYQLGATTPAIVMRMDHYAFRCNVCGGFFTFNDREGDPIPVPAQAVIAHLDEHGLKALMGEVPKPAREPVGPPPAEGAVQKDETMKVPGREPPRPKGRAVDLPDN